MLILLCLFFCASFTCAAITLGSAATFGVLSAATVTNTGATNIHGDLGTTGTAITGFPPGTYSGTEFFSTSATTPLNDAIAAFNAIAQLSGATSLTGFDLGGLVLAPGTYNFASSAFLTGTLTLAGTGSFSDAWYFQIGSTLITASNSIVVFTGGGLACNVYWQVGSSATLGTGTNFAGNILAAASVTMTTNAVSNGGVFALGAAVTLDTNIVNVETCRIASSTTLSKAATSTSSYTTEQPSVSTARLAC